MKNPITNIYHKSGIKNQFFAINNYLRIIYKVKTFNFLNFFITSGVGVSNGILLF